MGLAPGEAVTLTANNGQGGFPAWTAIPGTHRSATHADDIGRIGAQPGGRNILGKEMRVE